LKEGDILFVRSNGNKELVGRNLFIANTIEPLTFSGFCIRARFTKDDILPKFYAYLFKSKYFRNTLSANAGGTNINNLNQGILSNLNIPKPPLPTQLKIASILSAYDDLIETNLKRIKLLEEKAQIIYEEWFVQFRINGIQLVINKQTGLPDTWQKTSIKNYVSIISKGPSLDYSEGDVPVINQSCIRNGEIELEKILYAKELSPSKEDSYLKVNDILVNSMGLGTLGRVSKNVSISEKYIIHNCITFLRAKKHLSQYKLYYFIASKQDYFEGIAQGSTGQTTLKISHIEELEISLPTKEIMNDFDKIIEPQWKLIGSLKNQNTRLREARDIVLPRLMSGEIEV
jgi:type I restriction enzyme S subunit